MHRLTSITFLFAALLCLGFSTRSNAQDWSFSGAYFVLSDNSFSDISGGASAGFDDEEFAKCEAWSSSDNGNGYVQVVYRIQFTWNQPDDTPEDLYYHEDSAIHGSAWNATPPEYAQYGGGNPGYGSSHSDIGSLNGSCPSDYDTYYSGDVQFPNPDHADTANKDFELYAHAYAHSSSVSASATISTPPHG